MVVEQWAKLPVLEVAPLSTAGFVHRYRLGQEKPSLRQFEQGKS